MAPHLSIFLILLSSAYLHISSVSPYSPPDTSTATETFLRECPTKRCGGHGGPDIRFPFRLKTQPNYCGLEGFELSCSDEKTLLHLPFSGDFYISQIDYLNNFISIIDKRDAICPLESLFSLNLSSSVFDFTRSSINITKFNCFTNTVPIASMIGPINCLSTGDNSVFVVEDFIAILNYLPPNCWKIATAKIEASYRLYGRYVALRDVINIFLLKKEIVVGWSGSGSENCYTCEENGNHCRFNHERNQTFCLVRHGSHIPLIIGRSMGGASILLAVLLTVIYLYRRTNKQKETQLKVERFLANYKTFNPTRYTFADIKKMTNQFKHKLGQGGFGCVYKGKLLNGFAVAVKMLEISNGNGVDFVNEVATIGRIHHVNVVRLLGFCSEGIRRALIYEFMPNGSLEKFILAKEATMMIHRPFSWEKLQEISIGIARGIEYLHQGCNQRILHFDIKPHNILLDHNFVPKISDFGLAKLCSKEQSIVSMTAARGTIGYIAPELFSRNFGTVSYKSDVYSFGMLMLEIVGGRKNLDATVENHSQLYFPEWIYEQLSQGKDLGLEVEVEGDEEIVKRLAIVALWCIQCTPMDRPSMTMVVRMLEGDSQGLSIPPKPFFSSIADPN